MIISPEIIAEESDFAGLTEQQLTLRLLAVEQYIRNVTNNCFIVRGIDFEGVVENGKVIGSHPNIKPGDRVEIDDGGVNDGLYDVVSVGEVTELDSPLIDGKTVTVRLVRYPADVVFGALNLMKWDVDHRRRVGLQSETLSRHTVSYDVNGDKKGQGYPTSMLGFLKGYMKARF